MLVLGINKGKTLNGKELRLGGLAIVEDWRAKLVLSEERLGRSKGAPGYDKCLEMALKHAGPMLGRKSQLELDDFDAIVVSTCCERENAALQGHPLSGSTNLVAVNHHLSHASLAFFTSGFDRSLVIVIDGGGNTLTGDVAPSSWWKERREQHSYYLAHDQQIELIERDYVEPEAVGFGELFRAFTYFLGWHSSRFAAKLMALSAYGKPDHVSTRSPIYLENGLLMTPAINNPTDPVGLVRELGTKLGIDFGEPREPGSAIVQRHCDLASYVQKHIADAFVERLRNLMRQHGAKSLCLGGGVALNCLMNARVAQETGAEHVFVSSAPGDDGQALGNALYWFAKPSKKPHHSFAAWQHSSDTQLGPIHHVTSSTIARLVLRYDLSRGSFLTAEML